ncbi:MAG: DUF58 domain-containing protein [Deltaproteobacteria bacterium]|nr:DUF58 domain-containing protein [Deltaproteobacteria bacterium]
MDHAELFKEIRKIEIVTRHLVNDQLAGQYVSVFKGRGMAFDEVRQYQLGDDVRLIDWNVSARMNDIYIKKFVEEREMTVILAVDVSASEGFGTTQQTKSRLAAKVAATLAFSAIKNNDRVGLIMFTDRIELFVPPKKGKKHVLRVISEILRFKPEGRGTDLRAGLDYLGKVAKHRAVAFLISDFIADDWERSFRLANTRHDLIPICVSDPREEAIENLGVIYVEDPETGDVATIDTASRAVRQRYEAEIKKRRVQREQLFRRHRIDYINMSTDDVDMSPLVNFFRIRAKRAMRG